MFMLKRPCHILLAAVLTLLCIPVARAQSKVNLVPQSEPAIWLPFGGDMLLGGPHDTVDFSTGEKVKLGDPKLARWAEKMSTRTDQLSHLDMHAWLKVVSYYRIEKAEPALIKLAQMLIKRDRAVNDYRDQIFSALSMVATKKSIPALTRMLDEPIKDVEFIKAGTRQLGHRSLIAVALYRLGDEKGFDYLISSFRLMLIDQKNNLAVNAAPRDLLESSHHSELIKRIEAMRNDPQLSRINQRSIDSVLVTMHFIGQPLAKLREMVTVDSPENRNSRHFALTVLAERGIAEDIPRIEALYTKIINDPASTMIQRSSATRAILVIRCRLWKEQK